jgi:hypothetical protein
LPDNRTPRVGALESQPRLRSGEAHRGAAARYCRDLGRTCSTTRTRVRGSGRGVAAWWAPASQRCVVSADGVGNRWDRNGARATRSANKPPPRTRVGAAAPPLPGSAVLRRLATELSTVPARLIGATRLLASKNESNNRPANTRWRHQQESNLRQHACPQEAAASFLRSGGFGNGIGAEVRLSRRPVRGNPRPSGKACTGCLNRPTPTRTTCTRRCSISSRWRDNGHAVAR